MSGPSDTLPLLICVFVEIVWLTPFFVAIATLAYAKTEEAVDSRLISRLGEANIFILTALAARSIAFAFRHNARPNLAGLELAGVVAAMVVAFMWQTLGRLASHRRFDIGRRLQQVFAAVVVLMASMVLVGGFSPILRALNIFKLINGGSEASISDLPLNLQGGDDEKWSYTDSSIVGKTGAMDLRTSKNWVFSRQYDGDARPLTAKELAQSQGLLDRMGNVYVPEKPIKRSIERAEPEKIPRIVEYGDVSPKDLLPLSNRQMLVGPTSNAGGNMISAGIVPHLALRNGNLRGSIAVVGLYSSREAKDFFGRQFGMSRIMLSGMQVEMVVGREEIVARWTKRRFAFEADVTWSGEAPGTAPMEFMESIVNATAAAIDKKVQ